MTPPPAPEAGPRRLISLPEFVALTAALMAVNALGVDIMLPALPQMAADLGLANENDRQLVIICYMIGFGLAHLVGGPLSDRFGRRPVLFGSLALYVAGGVWCSLAPDFPSLILARIFQGAAAGGTRVAAVSASRDLYSGREMAKVMSLIMMVFMAAPILAPSAGQALLLTTDWRGIYWVLTALGLVALAWSFFRLPETLPPSRRRAFNLPSIFRAYVQVLSTRDSLGYTIASSFVFGGMMSYISSSEQIFHEVYHTGDAFPLFFAGAALSMSFANLVNSRLVERYGMRKLSHGALIGFLVFTAIHAALAASGPVAFPVFYGLLLLTFFTVGLQGPNFNSIAMEPVGELAGSAAAILGFASTLVAALLGGSIARLFDGTTAPIFIGQSVLGACALVTVLATERGRLFVSRNAGGGPST